MLESIKTLLTSKRAMVAFMVALFDILIMLGVGGLSPELAESIATLVTTIGGVLIAGISASDTGAAISQPGGVDHKGRSIGGDDAPEKGA